MNTPTLRFKEFSGAWEVKKLEQLALVERGKFSIRPRNDPRYFGGSIPFVQTGDVVFADLYLTRFSQTLNEEGLKVSRLFPKNTVLITIAANIGDTTITKFDVACTDSVVAIQPYDKKSNSVWLKLMLDTKKDELDSKATQNAQKNINLQILKPLLLNTPSFEEQTKIANFLTAIDEKIAQLSQTAQLLTDYKKGVMQQIFSQQLRFKDDDGREFAEWEEKELGSVANIIMGQSPDSKSYNDTAEGKPLIQGNADISNRKTKPRMWTSEPTKECKTDDIILTVRAPVGAVAKSYHNACIGRGVCAIRNNDKSTIDFIYQFLLWFEPIGWVGLEQGSTFTAVNSNDIRTLIIPVPSIPEQTKIANFLTAIDDKINHNQTQLDAMKQYKSGLLQQMFV